MPAVVAHYDGEPHLFFGSDRLELLGSFIGESALLHHFGFMLSPSWNEIHNVADLKGLSNVK